MLRDGRLRALARAKEKAARQFAGLPVEIVEVDITAVGGFAEQWTGVDVLFHAAAYFRESYQGGSHREELHRINACPSRRFTLWARLSN